MNLFNQIRINYGQDRVKELRQCESVERKLSRHRNHLVFSLRCKDEGIIPTSLRIRCPIQSRKAHDIIAKARKDLLNERIHITSKKVSVLKLQAQEKTTCLLSKLSAEEGEVVSSHLQRSKEHEYTKTKQRHMAKLERLKTKKLPPSTDIDLSGQQLKKWVVNLSKYALSDSETSALAKGLNFAITPKQPPVDEYVVAIEQACQKLKPNEADQLRSKAVNIISTTKLPTANVSKQETQALQNIAKNKDIICLPPDKGKGVVVLDKQVYIEKVNTMLSDEVTYERLPSDPTHKFKRKLVSILTRLLQDKKITDQQKWYLYPTTEVIPRLYCTPKIHKPDTPLRPIVDYTDSIGYNVSRSLADILGPMIGKSEHHVENVKDLVKSLKDVKLEGFETFVSFDVTSLFTKTPIPQALNIIKARLQADKTLKQRTKLSVEDIMEMLTFIANTTYFKFQGQLYQQKFGTAMGSPVSPLIANLFMEDLEKKAIATAPVEIGTRIWKRYVDDVLTIIPKDAVPQFTQHINAIDPTNSIKFTSEIMTDNHIAFLDADIHVKNDGTIKFKVYRKATHTNQYLAFTSHHHLSHKLSVARTLVVRADAIVTETSDKEEEMEIISEALSRCGYPEWTVDTTRRKIQEGKVKDKGTAKTKEKYKGQVTIPYAGGLAEHMRRLLKTYKISTSFKPMNKISHLIVQPEDKIEKDDKCGVFYEVQCKKCAKTYIGETSRKLGTGIAEQRKDVDTSST